MARITSTMPKISIQFIHSLKKITLRIAVTIGCSASIMLTTSEGANLVACISIPNGIIVPNKTTVETDATSVPVMCGGLTQNGWYRLNKTPAIAFPQPNTTSGEFSSAAFCGKTT